VQEAVQSALEHRRATTISVRVAGNSDDASSLAWTRYDHAVAVDEPPLAARDM
jgi:hypothetical protein